VTDTEERKEINRVHAGMRTETVKQIIALC